MSKSLILLFVIIYTVLNFAHSEDKNFTQLIRKSLELDPDYAEIKAIHEVQRVKEMAATSKLFLPALNFQYSFNKDQKESTNFSEYKYSAIELSYPITNFGADYLYFKSQKDYNLSSKMDLIIKEIELEKIIMDLFFQIINIQNEIEIEKEVVSLKENSLKISEKKFSNGTLSKDDLLKVQIDLYNAQSELIQKESLYQKQLVGLSYYKVSPTKLKSYPWSNQIKKNGISKIINLEKNEDIYFKFAQFQLDGINNEISSQKRRQYGEISFKYSRNFMDNYSDEDYGWSTSLVYTLPIFTHFSELTTIKQLHSLKVKNNLLQERYKSDYQSKQKYSLENLKLSYKDFIIREKTYTATKSLFNSILKQFKKGSLSVNDLLSEQNRFATTKKVTIQANYNLHMAVMNYLHSKNYSVNSALPLIW